jgi:uncharacterized protein
LSPSEKRKTQGSLRTRRPARTKFIVDAMLGSLARKLRALGFDTSYYKEGGDSGLIAAARTEARWILTSDRSLALSADSKGLQGVLLRGKTDGVRLREIADAALRRGLPLVRGDSLCSKCGSELEMLSRKDVSGMVPQSVQMHHRDFFRCVGCGQVYWHGSHWKKLRSLARRLG